MTTKGKSRISACVGGISAGLFMNLLRKHGCLINAPLYSKLIVAGSIAAVSYHIMRCIMEHVEEPRRSGAQKGWY